MVAHRHTGALQQAVHHLASWLSAPENNMVAVMVGLMVLYGVMIFVMLGIPFSNFKQAEGK